MRGGGKGLRARVAGCVCLCLLAGAARGVEAASPNGTASAIADVNANAADEPLSADARYAAQWIVDADDHRGLPFAIVDKKAARLFVFGPRGRLVGAAPALVGSASGDHATPGTGQLEPARIPLAERTTPAGRFASEPGRNLGGEAVVWVDYDAGLAIHRVRPDAAEAQREQRLASATPDDNRASLGCIVVMPAFYDGVVTPWLGAGRGVVYVLPESRPVAEMFGAAAPRVSMLLP